jgi:hypothetical protein
MQQQVEQETSGSILSPSWQNSMWSKTNYWFIESKWYHSISSTLDTPGQ